MVSLFPSVLVVAGPQSAPLTADALRPATPGLRLKAASAASWTDGQTNIVLLRGGVEIQAGEATLRATDAVLWLEKLRGESRTRVDVVLLGTAEVNAAIETPEARKYGTRLAADLVIQGGVRLDVPEREARDLSDTPIYEAALVLRPVHEPVPSAPGGPARPGEAGTTTRPGTTSLEGTATTRPVAPVQLTAAQLRTAPGTDGKLAILASGGVFLMQRSANEDLIELRAAQAVVFTNLRRLDEVAGGTDLGALQEAITGVYLEGDVRIVFTPSPQRRRGGGFGSAEQRLEAQRAFYDFLTDRAMLTRVVLHTTEPAFGQPLTLRAQTVRQLALGQYEARQAEISTSRFAVPDYSLNASRVFVRSGQTRAVFGGDHVTARLFEVPFFYFPAVRGATIDNRLPLRSVAIGHSRDFGAGIDTQWGLFETLGLTPPQSLDASYSLGYLGDRGLTAGLDAEYRGEIFRFGNRPELFQGGLTAFGVRDHGADNLGRRRAQIHYDDVRGHVFWQHQHYLPGDIAAFGRVGYVSDPTFLEQWRREQFWDGAPHDLAFAVERSNGNQVFGVAAVYELNDFATSANVLQENLGVERLPEASYARLGDRLGPLTLSSRHRVGLLQFNNYGVDPLADLGFQDRAATTDFDESFRGIPAYGYTGAPEQLTARGDFRQEVALPLHLGGGLGVRLGLPPAGGDIGGAGVRRRFLDEAPRQEGGGQDQGQQRGAHDTRPPVQV